jgi:acyl dehydratase
VVGWHLPTLRIERVDPERMKVMALLLHDPNPIHFDPATVTSLGNDPRVINQGPISLGYVVTMLAGWLGDESGVTGIDCRYLANVRAEDTVVVGGEVLGVEQGEDGTVTARCGVWLDIEGSGRALSGSATVRVPGGE